MIAPYSVSTSVVSFGFWSTTDSYGWWARNKPGDFYERTACVRCERLRMKPFALSKDGGDFLRKALCCLLKGNNDRWSRRINCPPSIYSSCSLWGKLRFHLGWSLTDLHEHFLLICIHISFIENAPVHTARLPIHWKRLSITPWSDYPVVRLLTHSHHYIREGSL